jgi:nitrogen regulatory protein P-II 1
LRDAARRRIPRQAASQEGTSVKKIEAVIRQEKLPVVRGALEELGLTGLTITQVLGHGAQKGITHQWKGNVYRVDLVPKVKLDMIVKDSMVDSVLEAIAASARTGEVGDGKVFVSNIEEVMRVRTGERGEVAV